MLVGRDKERARIRRVLADARRGRSGALVLRGEAGIGKTALLDDAARSARGMTVLRTRGVESEAELPYAGMVTLVRPELDVVSLLPDHQARPFLAALRLGPANVADPLAVCAATLAFLAAVAESQPLLLLVDDAHWLDRETAQAVGFAARRLADERVAVLVASREGEPSGFVPDGIEELFLGGLGGEEAAQLLGGRVVAPVALRLADVTSGNPLALLELAGRLSDGQRAGVEPVREPLPVGEELERAFGRRAAGLSPAAKAVLVVAAAAGERDDLQTLAAAWSRLGSAQGDVDEAERARLVSVDGGRLRFRHPLVRAAVYAQASAPDRRAAHSSLARALDAEADADERGWHVALAAVGPDEEAAATIEAVGLRAAGRSRRAALRALTRAAELTPDGDEKVRRILAAAQGAADAGAWDEAAELLDRVPARAAGGELAGHLLYLQGVVAARRESGIAAADLLERAATALELTDPERAALALVQAAQLWGLVIDGERALAATERAALLPIGRGSKTELALLLARGDAACVFGRLDVAARFWRGAADLVDPDDPDQLQMGGEALFSAGDDDAARELLHRAEWLARERAALGTLTTVLFVLALSETRAGDLQGAYLAASECVALMRAIGQRQEQPEALALVAWIEAMLGRETECRRHVEEANALNRGSPLGLLELSRGRPDRAVEPFEETMRVRASRLDLEPIAPRQILPSYVEALARVGRTEDAACALGGRVEIARSTGRPDAVAPFLRAQALLEGEETFREALAWHDRWANRFERGRTELCYGELLRRLKRRAEARGMLRAAVEHFDSVGAVIWAERARAELAATGKRARRRVPSTVDDLTPQEIQVARLVSTGLTNREVATRLFLSPKTIETHLGHVFRKTGVRTRAELAHRFRDSPDSIALPAS